MPSRVLQLIRGLPGSGKSTIAETLVHSATRSGRLGMKFEADDYRINEAGEYQFDLVSNEVAHGKCQSDVREEMSAGCSVVIVSNTFTQLWEMEPYVEMARQYGYTVQIITVQADFGNIHDVPEEAISRMRGRFEFDAGRLIGGH